MFLDEKKLGSEFSQSDAEHPSPLENGQLDIHTETTEVVEHAAQEAKADFDESVDPNENIASVAPVEKDSSDAHIEANSIDESSATQELAEHKKRLQTLITEGVKLQDVTDQMNDILNAQELQR